MEEIRQGGIATAIRAQIASHQARITSLRSLETVEQKQLSSAAVSEREAAEKVSAARTSLAAIRASQHPLSAYLKVYSDFRKTVTKHNEATLELQEADRALGETVTVFHDRRDELADFQAAVGDAMSSGTSEEKVATRAAAANGINALESARKVRDEAKNRCFMVREKVLAALLLMDALSLDLVRCRENLDPADAQTAKLLAALEAYEAALGAKAKSARAVKAATDELMRWQRASNDPSREFTAKKESYLQAHRQWLVASKALNVLLQRDGFSGVTQAQIDRAQEEERATRSVDRRTKVEMNDARKRMDDDRALELTLRRELEWAHARFKQELDKLAPAAAKVGDAVDSAIEAMGPAEKERLKLVDEETQKFATLMDGLSEASSKWREAERALNATVQQRIAAEVLAAQLREGYAAASDPAWHAALQKFSREFKGRDGKVINRDSAMDLEDAAIDSSTAVAKYGDLHNLAFPNNDSWKAAAEVEEILDRLYSFAQVLRVALPE